VPVGILIILAAVAIGGFTMRTARERGRGPGRWVALSVTAAVVGWLAALVELGWDMIRYQVTDSIGTVIFSYVTLLFAPLTSMGLVLGVLYWLPVRTPEVGGASWLVYWMSAGDRPGANVQLRVENGRLQLGDLTIETVDQIVADGECVRIVWAGGSADLLPIEKSRTPLERARWSEGLANRLRQIVKQ
jgi:hypothetical protein